MTIKRMIISGFRGVLAPYRLDFQQGRNVRSMVIYGQNGTGKSSITDAWEWFQKGRIEHLRREGAGEGSYPNRNANPGETYVEIEFVDARFGTIRLEFDHSRIRTPISVGDIGAFRNFAPHPCQIRFEDLTRFVYFRKSEKYDALADLMGFTPQVDFQKALKRVSNQLDNRVETQRKKVSGSEQEVRQCLNISDSRSVTVLNSINALLVTHGLQAADSFDALPEKIQRLTERVTNDPRAQKLNDCKSLRDEVNGITLPNNIISGIDDYLDKQKSFQEKKESITDLLLIELLTKGDEILKARSKAGLETDICPLCNQHFEPGDLPGHIASELENLKDLREKYDQLELNRKTLLNSIPKNPDNAAKLKKLAVNSELEKEYNLNSLITLIKDFEEIQRSLRTSISQKSEKLDDEQLQKIKNLKKALENVWIDFVKARKALIEQLRQSIADLEEDEVRKKLVSDHSLVQRATDYWNKLVEDREQLSRLESVNDEFTSIVRDYIQASMENVKDRFAVISADVQTYFDILERYTNGISKPVLKLLENQDRAVEFEVEFQGERIYPAYKYLSESQLNSFGLVIFLASVKNFNPDFKFIILDDVINSFDAYKRPQVIELLKQEFSDYQVLILTHDNVWRDQLFENFDTWIKRRISRHDPGIGPIDTIAHAPLAEIEQLIADDRPEQAGALMGPYLERQLQDICQNFGVLVPFTRDGLYTLDTLLDRLRIRIKDKLGTSHSLYLAVETLQHDSGFRNLCSHWKNPTIHITAPEMHIVVDKWKDVESQVRCPTCRRYVKYVRSHGFMCVSCGKVVMKK